MSGNASLFSEIEESNGGSVTFGDNDKGKIIGVGKIGVSPNAVSPVYLVKGLKHNLLSISQLCDKGLLVKFTQKECSVIDSVTQEIRFSCQRSGNIYTVRLLNSSINLSCLKAAIHDDSWLWHRRLGHISMRTIKKLASKDLVRGLPKCAFSKDRLCDACVKGKQVRSSFKPIKSVSTSRVLELLHMDLCGKIPVKSLGEKSYILVIIDDYSRYTWVCFIKKKKDAFGEFSRIYRQIQVETQTQIQKIRSDHGREFDYSEYANYCDEHGIHHNFSAPKTPQQNGVVERKNRTVEDIARTMLI